jgi:membrane carboxypeptidase/penicillin-binding protein
MMALAEKADMDRKKLPEDERILSVQLELFSKASPEEQKLALLWLKKYRDLELIVRDYEEHAAEYSQTAVDGEMARRISSEEYYANKTANAVIIAEGQRKLYEEAHTIVTTLRRSVNLILDEEARKAVYCRYIEGFTYKETLLFLKRREKSSTLDRRLKTGIVTVANVLGDWGFYEIKWNF